MCHPHNSQFSILRDNEQYISVSKETADSVFASCKHTFVGLRFTEPISFLNEAFSLLNTLSVSKQYQILFELEAPDAESITLDSETFLEPPCSSLSEDSVLKRQAVTNNTGCQCDDSPPHGNLTLAINRTLNSSYCPQWSGVCCSSASEASLIANLGPISTFTADCKRAVIDLLCISICFPDNAPLTSWFFYNTTNATYFWYTNRVTTATADNVYSRCQNSLLPVINQPVHTIAPSASDFLALLGDQSAFNTPSITKPRVQWNITDVQPSIDFELHLPPNGPTCFEPLTTEPTSTSTTGTSTTGTSTTGTSTTGSSTTSAFFSFALVSVILLCYL